MNEQQLLTNGQQLLAKWKYFEIYNIHIKKWDFSLKMELWTSLFTIKEIIANKGRKLVSTSPLLDPSTILIAPKRKRKLDVQHAYIPKNQEPSIVPAKTEHALSRRQGRQLRTIQHSKSEMKESRNVTSVCKWRTSKNLESTRIVEKGKGAEFIVISFM